MFETDYSVKLDREYVKFFHDTQLDSQYRLSELVAFDQDGYPDVSEKSYWGLQDCELTWAFRGIQNLRKHQFTFLEGDDLVTGQFYVERRRFKRGTDSLKWLSLFCRDKVEVRIKIKYYLTKGKQLTEIKRDYLPEEIELKPGYSVKRAIYDRLVWKGTPSVMKLQLQYVTPSTYGWYVRNKYSFF